jgi:GH25 family lysozyme M1 (1,4-beta-N-acetylmuramidase)
MSNYLTGYDFSSLDNVDVTKLLEGTAFVINRCIRQNGVEDPTFQQRYHALRDQRPEIVRMNYLFFNCYKDGISQANAMLAVGVNYLEEGNGPIWIDLEADSGSVEETYIMQNRAAYIAQVNACMDTLLNSPQYGRPDIGIYSNDSFLRETVAHTWPDKLFWLASYQPNIPGNPAQPVDFWQYAQYGTLAREVTDFTTQTGSIDLDYCVHNQNWLDNLANKTPTT